MAGGVMFPDFPDATNYSSRRHDSTTRGASRRETILSLVEMLLEKGEGVPKRQGQPPDFVPEDVSPIDRHLQDSGADAFNKFSGQMSNFDQELRDFANAARQLGSSIAILSSAFHLRERVAQIHFLYRENAAALFPLKILRTPRECTIYSQTTGLTGRRSRRSKTLAHIVQPSVNETIDVDGFPDQMEGFAADIGTFLHCLNEFPEFTDEAVNACILSFERDLRYWASCLEEYRGQFRTPAVQRYLHDLSIEMGEHINSITSTLSIFVEIGVPIIHFSQKHAATNLLNLSAVATLFSGVTATTIQFSYALKPDRLSIPVNSFWFASLVFSIAAVVNSLLGSTWKQAMYRSPGHRVPWWVLIWIKRSPLLFLVMSVACFLFGFCFFAYASGQDQITSTITTVLTALTSLGLCLVSAWLAMERWISVHYQGKKWLDEALTDITDTMFQTSVVDSSRRVSGGIGSGLGAAKRVAFRALIVLRRGISDACSRLHGETGDNDYNLPVYNNDTSDRCLDSILEERQTDTVNASEPRTQIALASDVGPSARSYPSSLMASHENPLGPKPHRPTSSPPSNSGTISPGKQRWRDAFDTIRVRNTIATNRGNVLSTHQDAPNETSIISVMRPSVARFGLGLADLEAVQDLPVHSALVKHLQFSPDGKYLATSSWDRTSVILKVGDPFVPHRILAHARNFVGQAAWSPDGKYLLTKMTKGMNVWTTEDGVCLRTIMRKDQVEAITWCHHDNKFMSVEGNNIYQLDITGQQLNVFNLGSVKLHDVAITPDDRRLLAIGPLLQSPSGLLPSRSRSEKRLIVFNTEHQQTECQVPILNDVRDITLVETSRGELVALISCENEAPPQLWRLEILKGVGGGRESSRLTLRHTYMPKLRVDFAGPSYFGGHKDELVLCAGKKGDIFIWETESGALLRHIRPRAGTGDLTCIAWNQAATDSVMFATGNHDGTVQIWSKPSDPRVIASEEPNNHDQQLTEKSSLVYGEIGQPSNSNASIHGAAGWPISHNLEPSDDFHVDSQMRCGY